MIQCYYLKNLGNADKYDIGFIVKSNIAGGCLYSRKKLTLRLQVRQRKELQDGSMTDRRSYKI